LILIMALLSIWWIYHPLVLIFLGATFLETFFSYCLGCKTYSLIQKIKKQF
jgi:hypothetical protein